MNIPAHIIQTVKIYFTALVFFSVFRLALFFTEIGRIDASVPKSDIFQAFIMGFRFDLVIIGYILILPYVLWTGFSFFQKENQTLTKILFYYTSILFSLSFFICGVDIPYFNQFFARFSITAFEWIDSPTFVFKMIIQEPRNWLVIIALISFIYLFIRINKKIFFHSNLHSNEKLIPKILLSLLFLGFIGLGIRGRISQKSPIRVGTAYFCNNAFLNQLGLNPNFTLIRSYLDSKKAENQLVNLMEDKAALDNVQQYLHILNANNDFPLRRNISFDSTNAQKYNVVLVIMESMSAAKMVRHGNPLKLTPFLDSISNKGYYFENNYSAGIHTFNGIFSTLFSYPALFRQHPMKESAILKYDGIFSHLKKHDYSSIYFTTHDGQFDNVEGFLKANDCERVITSADYPADKIKTTLGVPDDFMFEFSMPILNQLHEKNKPFFATFMTVSDHTPFYIPEYFTPTQKEMKHQITEYADWSLRKLIHLSSQQKWFENTIFVFVADHGAPLDGLYDMSIDYNHAPLLFYAPNILKEPQTFSKMSGQIDISPTIMGLLKLPYQNNSLGIDLFRENRPYIFFGADDKYGVMDQEWFLIVRSDKTKMLYKYKEKDTHNYAQEKGEIVAKMNEYAMSNLQTAQYVIRTKKQ